MNLEGSLGAFSLPDIFQLLSFTKKNGGLHLASGGQDGAVFFTGGQVTGASADSSRQPLARRLIGGGAVDDDALLAAVEKATSPEGSGIAKALLEAGSVQGDVLRQAVTDQAVDAVFDLLTWADGDFAFVLDETNPDDVGVAITVESVVADAGARTESWEAVSKIIPSPKVVLTMPVMLPGDPELTREEWSLLALTDGRRSVADLVDLTGCGQFAVVSILAALVERGLLSVRDPDAGEEDHVGVVVRRQRLLGPLEGAAFTPVREPAPPGGPPHTQLSGDFPVGPAEQEVPDLAHDTTPGDRELVTASTAAQPVMLGGAHVPGDVVPPRPEPFLPKRTSQYAESDQRTLAATGAIKPTSAAGPGAAVNPSPPGHHAFNPAGVDGSVALALDPATIGVIERDPSVNRSLMLRLIAGVRGL